MARKSFSSQKQDLAKKLMQESGVEHNNLTSSIAEEFNQKTESENINQNGLLLGNPDEFIPYYDEKLRLDIHTGEEYERLKESIKQNGILQPIICTMYEGSKMIIAGHNRVQVAKELEIQVPYILKENIDKDTMDLICIDTNLLNRQISDFAPSQLAYILKTKVEAEKHTGIRYKDGELTYMKIGKEYELSKTNMYRYIKLNELIPEALKMVDESTLSIRAAYEVANFPEKVQQILVENSVQVPLKIKLIEDLKKELKKQAFETDDEAVEYVKTYLSDIQSNKKKIVKTPYKEFREYIPSEIDGNDVEGYIISALKHYKEYLEG